MKRRTKSILAAAVGLTLLGAGAGYAHAMVQATSAAELRATGRVGEQSNGYLGTVGDVSPELRARVNAVNVRRRASYTELAGRRGVTIEEVGATMACELFATAVGPGQYYRLADGVWRQRQGNAPVPRPAYCG